MSPVSKEPLKPKEAALIEAAAARIFPTTSTPGAVEAGAVEYIRRLLAEAYPETAPLYRSGCRALESHARSRFGKGFLAIAPAEQDEVLRDFEAARVPGYKRAADFFETLLEHTMEGVLGEPAYGGNRGLAGWRLVGFPGHQFGYADPYIDRPVDIEPVAVDRPYPTEEEWRGKSR
jgi:gluconate 2-dehydrogenase gamma chain